MKVAHAHEVKDRHEDHNSCSDEILNRLLVRVIQTARDVPV
jgi:hypothetical protein